MDKKDSFTFTCILSSFSLLSVALTWSHNVILFIVLFTLATFMLLLERSGLEARIFVFCAISGAVAEFLAISFGAWSYANPNILSIPIWLPLLWGIASIFIIRAYAHFSR